MAANTTRPGGELLCRPSSAAGELLMGNITPVISHRLTCRRLRCFLPLLTSDSSCRKARSAVSSRQNGCEATSKTSNHLFFSSSLTRCLLLGVCADAPEPPAGVSPPPAGQVLFYRVVLGSRWSRSAASGARLGPCEAGRPCKGVSRPAGLGRAVQSAVQLKLRSLVLPIL